MQWNLAQSSNSPGQGWLIFKVAAPVIFFMIVSIFRALKVKAEERAKEKRASNLQREVELEAIRTGRGLEQVLARSGDTQTVTVAADLDDPKVRRERQLAELRRRAAARSQSAPISVRTAGTATGSTVPSQPMPVLVRQASTPPRPMPKPKPVQQRPVQRPQQKPQKMTGEQARQLKQRRAAERQPVPTRAANPYVSDVPDASETHRLVGDSDAAKVTARQVRRGPNLGRAGIRQAVIMSEILGRPRSERLDEI